MRIHNRHDIAQACAIESRRSAFECVHLQGIGGKPHAVASDGRILALVPVTLDADEGEQCHGGYAACAFSMARTAYLTNIPDEFPDGLGPDLSHAACEYRVDLLGAGEARVGDVAIGVSAGELPDLRAIIGMVDDPVCKFAIDVDLLVRLCAAIGTRKVSLEFRGPRTAIVVRPTDETNEAGGYLMPLGTEDGAPQEMPR